MDYKAFYAKVADWIYQVNQNAIKFGMDSDEFWNWVADSIGEICNKYNNNPLVKKQMTMLHDWLEEIYQKGREKNE
ncbi:hypothetical protein AWH56_005295 [Anaerobacillus isosaccharinicus]|uniref:Uncharacterized protein n=1 Tax=Anaerobacillus isosaccharinicus TaxID=1532552 RepID=A0A1S2L973_9BACI|nr:hypothetical protein [Anaerobacillus isosaccharinicus]MBA5584558.1 hypothetical protein [Anaerobacillus isosaccharinicus]QOY37058.1 hypothetical protein AWH56_005295 [Anaerobacillus isosaccharinicus]